MHGPIGKEKIDQMKRLKESQGRIRHKLMVMSGKGGVGKSSLTVNLAVALHDMGLRVGILDTDFHGPNVPHMLGLEAYQMGSQDDRLIPLEVKPGFVVVSLASIGKERNAAFIWRGPIKIGLIHQLLADVEWGDLDVLLIDSPPGTGDEPLTVCQTLIGSKGALVVSSPQSVSRLDTGRSLTFLKEARMPILGVIENMSAYLHPETREELPLFGPGSAQEAAQEAGVPFLGSLPFDPLAAAVVHEGATWPSLEGPLGQKVKDLAATLHARLEAAGPVQEEA